jgi:hypothetical protein
MTETYPVLDSAAAAQYSYYTVDIVTNTILAEIPFEDVTYERTLKGAGAFDGKIAINTQTKDLDLYNSTLPGKCALYVVRDGVCMWGGIIWGRSYDLFSRSLNVTASEFTSYLKHRIIWKTYSYQFTATVRKSTKKSPATVTLQNTSNVNLKIPIKVLDDYGNLNSVYVSFTRSDLIQYNNYYTLSASETPTTTTFAINIPDIPVGTHTDVSVSVRVDTYEYLKELMKEAAQDFIDTQFANEIITPGIKIPYEITNKVASGGLVTLTTSITHGLVVGQNVEIRNVDENVDGYRVVSEVPSSTSFRVVVPAYDIVKAYTVGPDAFVEVDVTDTNDQFKLTVGSFITISGVPLFNGYNYFNFSNVKITQVISNNIFKIAIPTHPRATVSITNITSNASIINYFATNTFTAGEYVTIANSNVKGYNLENRLITYADGVKFTIANPTGVAISQGFVDTNAGAYIDVPIGTTGSPGVVSQISIASTNIYTNKYEVSTRALKPTKPYGVESASRVKNSDKTVFVVTLQLSKTSTRSFPFQKGDTITMNLLGDTKDTNGEYTFTSLTNGDGGGTVLSAVDKKNKTVSYELTGISTKNKSDAYIGDITKFTLGTANNTINYANAVTEIELGLSELQSFRTDQYVYVTGVDGASWSQPVYNGYHKITATTPAGSITTSVTYYESSAGVAKLYTAKNNSFDNNDEVTIAGFTGGLTTLNGAIRVLDSVQGSLDGESYFTYFIDDNTTRAKTLVSGVTAKVKGSNKIRYDLPEYNPMGEPDSTFNAIKYKVVGYASTATDKRSKVTIQTQEIISIKAGDSVNVAIGDDSTDGSYKIDTVGNSGYTFTYTIPVNKSVVKKSGDDTFKNCTGVVSRYMAQLDQQSLTYSPSISGLSCEQNVVTVYSNNHQYSPNDLVSLKSFPSGFEHYDNNGFKAQVQNVDTDYFSYTLTNFRDGTTSAPTAGVAQISKYKFTKNAKNATSGTIRFTTIRDHFYTVGSKVLVSGVPKSQTGTTFLKSIVWSNVHIVSAVSTPGATIKYFDVAITGLTSAATTAEFTSLTNTIPTAGNSSPAGTTDITLVTGSAHGIAVDKKVTVSGVTPEAYNGTWTTQAGTTGSTIILNIGSNPGAVTVAGNVSLGKAVSTAQIVVASKALTSGSATATTLTYVGTSLPFTSGQKVTIVGFTGTGSTRLNTSGTVNASSTSTSLVVSLAGATASSSSSGVPFAYATAAVTPKASIDYSQSVSAQEVLGFSAVASTQVVTLYSPNHGFSNQDLLKFTGMASAYAPKNSEPALITKIDDDTFSYVAASPASPSFASDVPVSGSITGISSASGTVTFTASNSFSVGDRLVIKDVLPDVYNFYNAVVTGATGSNFQVSSPETSAYISSNGVAMRALVPTATAINAPYISLSPVVFSRSFGEFPNNTNIGGLDFDGTTYSGNFYPNTIVRGSDMITLDAHMEQYSNSVNGFNYRIDCTLESVGDSSTFKRKFVLVPITPPTLKEYLNTLPSGVLGRGDVAPPSAFGADKITFEHPGNVRNVNLSESAENSATRMFVSGNNGAGDPNSVARFSGAADNDLLDAGWPILDRAEKIDWPTQYNPLTVTVNRDNWGNYDAEADFHATAQRFLYQSRPPQGDFIIRVNGSLSPVIGTYNPGDWCQLIVDDESGFINSRLSSTLEPRKDVIIRRIDNIKVSVPNSPTFPEDIDLTLVTDWEVDRIGK